jgi:hypothetical protein
VSSVRKPQHEALIQRRHGGDDEYGTSIEAGRPDTSLAVIVLLVSMPS